jgi:LCP family protein required for cell wall assembly
MLTLVQRSRLRAAWRFSFTAVLVLLLATFSVAGLNAWKLSRTFDTEVEKIADAFPAESTRPHVLPSSTLQAQNVLFLGADSVGSSSSSAGSLVRLAATRPDTVMVVHVPANRANAYVMAVLRASRLDIPGHGQGTIAEAVAEGGVALAVQTAEALLGVRMDHVAIVDFAGFQGVTDALGGVTIDNPVGFTSSQLPGHYFAEGVQHLDGTDALAFIRERAAFPGGDVQRVRNQQILIQALIGLMLKEQTLISPGEISDLVAAVAPHLAVDDEFSLAYLATSGAELHALRAGDIRFFALPTVPVTAPADGEQALELDPAALAAARHAFQADALGAYLAAARTER